MANRNKGILNISANFEIQNSAPFDARSRVKTLNSLILEDTWKSSDDGVYVYDGMIVVVYADGVNNGIYRLENASDYQNAESWKFVGGSGEPGKDGLNMLSGDTEPNNENGVDGEIYLHYTVGDLYKKEEGVWVLKANVNGDDGNDGTDGLSMLSGSVDPTNEGVDGDLYLNLTSYELFKKESDSWVSQGIIKGTDGTTPDTSAFYKNNSISANISGTYNIDLNNAENYFLTVTANTEFSLTPINKDNINQSVTVVFKMDGTGGYVLSTSENIYWKDELPTFNTDPNAINIVTFMSFDKGVTWIGHLVGSNYVNS